MTNSDAALWEFVVAIVGGNAEQFAKMLAANPALARARFEATNATRQSAEESFVASVKRYIYRGDTALHFASAAHDSEMIDVLIKAGADPRAKNRLGDEPLHAAATGDPLSERWNPNAQSAAIRSLIRAGADPNAANKSGVAPLHRAVRTRCAAAVKTLIELGADPAKKTGSGTTSMQLGRMNTGRSGSGSTAAKEQQVEIIRMLQRAIGLEPAANNLDR